MCIYVHIYVYNIAIYIYCPVLGVVMGMASPEVKAVTTSISCCRLGFLLIVKTARRDYRDRIPRLAFLPLVS